MATTTQTQLTPAGTVPMTADELYHLGKEERRGELIRGVFCPDMPNNPNHAEVLLALGALLYDFVKTNESGKVLAGDPGVHLERDPDTVRAPDVAFYAAGRVPSLQGFRGFLDVIPDLVVEVVSPSQTANEAHDKAHMWLYNGVRLVWNVWPDTRTIEVFSPDNPPVILHETDTLTGQDVLPQFTAPVSAIFEN